MAKFQRLRIAFRRRWFQRLSFHIQSCANCAYSGPAETRGGLFYCPNELNQNLLIKVIGLKKELGITDRDVWDTLLKPHDVPSAKEMSSEQLVKFVAELEALRPTSAYVAPVEECREDYLNGENWRETLWVEPPNEELSKKELRDIIEELQQLKREKDFQLMKSLQKEPRDFLQMDVFMHKGVCNIGCEDATFLMGGAFAVRILVNPGTEAAAVAKILRETADFVLEPDGVYDYHDI